MATLLEIKQSSYQGRVSVMVFQFIGELDAITNTQFQTEVQQAIEAGARYMVLDFSQLDYISSLGLRSLYMLAKALSAKGGPAAGIDAGIFKSPYLKLLNPSSNVRQVLDMTGFNMAIEIHSNLNEALASF